MSNQPSLFDTPDEGMYCPDCRAYLRYRATGYCKYCGWKDSAAKPNHSPVPLAQPRCGHEKTAAELTADFISFHERNLHIYATLKEIATEMYGTGKTHFAIGACVERLRYLHPQETDGEGYMLPNAHRSFYSRLLACDLPQFREWFTFVRSKADNPTFHAYLREQTGVTDPVTAIQGEGK